MIVRWLLAVAAMPMSREPGHVHRAGMRQRLPRASQAGNGQEERESEGAAPAESPQHGAKVSRGLLLRKPDPPGHGGPAASPGLAYSLAVTTARIHGWMQH